MTIEAVTRLVAAWQLRGPALLAFGNRQQHRTVVAHGCSLEIHFDWNP